MTLPRLLPVLMILLALAARAETNRPAAWAQPVALAGVPNLHQVGDGLYRSGQPTAEGMCNLKALGIRTVVNLRSHHSDKDEIGTNALGLVEIEMSAWRPERGEAVRFLSVVANPSNAPVLVHCLHGADRTGTMCALYRIAAQGWTPDDAVREMTDGGFNFHAVFDNLPEWIRAMDIEKLRRDSGLTDPKPR